jgi:hypothetical protein
MPLDADLLNKAKTAEARMVDAEHEAEITRADFHRALRRLHLAGASFREIAGALGLSHQRVYQIVEAAGGSRPWRRRRSDAAELLTCSFCGQDQKHVKKLIAGPGVFICDRCIDRVDQVLAITGQVVTTPIAVIEQVSAEASTEWCTFCDKSRHEVAAMASAGTARICDECLRLCLEIRQEEAAGELPPPEAVSLPRARYVPDRGVSHATW